MTGICAISSVAKAKIREKAHGEPQPELVFMRYNLVSISFAHRTPSGGSITNTVQPHVPYIRTCGETLDKLGRAHWSEEAIAIIRAYIEPQVLDKKRGQPRWSLTTLEHSVSCVCGRWWLGADPEQRRPAGTMKCRLSVKLSTLTRVSRVTEWDPVQCPRAEGV